jgi:hypothetical protein
MPRPATSSGRTLRFQSHGVGVDVRAGDPRILARVRRLIPPGSVLHAPRRVHVRYSIKPGSNASVELHRLEGTEASATVVASSRDAQAVLQALEADLHFQVALRAQPTLFVHAGVVRWRRKAIVIPGRSMSGKSSLVAALVRAGATYYSDEYAVLDRAGRVWPFARRLLLREGRGSRGTPKYSCS